MSESGKPAERIDLNEVERLVAALERDLDRARRGEAGIGALRGEVEQLRATLASDEVAHEEVQRGLLGVRNRLHALGDTLFDDALKAGEYLTRVGRLLGM
jgi:hypothetical protein